MSELLIREDPTKHSDYPTYWPKLYKTGSGGKEQEWQISAHPAEDGTADIVTGHGQVEGKKQEARVHIRQGKNLGKKNETTPWQQACSEAESKWLKQKDKGYSEERGGASMSLKPMLAQKYEDRKKKVVFPAYLQPKLDGVRCLAYRKSEDEIVLISRQSKEFAGLAHIRDDLKQVMQVGETFDGELYVHGVPFQTVISWVKKEQPDSAKLQYHVYDTIGNTWFFDRYMRALRAHLSVVKSLPDLLPSLRLVPLYPAMSHDDVEEFHTKCLSDGYEGCMLRWGNEPYKAGYRSEHLLKVKAFQDQEFDIVDVVEGKGKFEGRAIFVCRTSLGAEFEAVPKGRDELRQRYFAERDKLIGKLLTVRFFEWTSSDPPVPRFPVATVVRDYE